MGQSTVAQELELLYVKLTQTEDELARAHGVIKAQAGAIIDTDLKIYHAMKQLLTANDVRRDEAMRINILEIMNELRRFAHGRFVNAGIDAFLSAAPNGQKADAVFDKTLNKI